MRFSFFSFTVVPGPPGKPQALNIDSTQVTLSWSPPEITGYFVERKQTGNSTWVRVNDKPVQETTLVVTGLTENTHYQFRVLAENSAGIGHNGEVSDVFKTKLPYGKDRSLLNMTYLSNFVQ